MNDSECEQLVNGAVDRLGEHFEAVQIMVTWQDEGNTKSLYRGSGNWYARRGLAHELINADVAQENARQIAEQLEVVDGDEDVEEE